MNMLSCGWIWMYVGALLMFLELVTPGFVMFFFGLSAATVGVIRLSVGDSFTASWQLCAFSVLSVVYLVLLRRWVSGVFTGVSTTDRSAIDDELVGRVGEVVNAINPGVSGRVRIGDAEWNADSDVPLAAGASVKVVSSANLTVRVAAV